MLLEGLIRFREDCAHPHVGHWPATRDQTLGGSIFTLAAGFENEPESSKDPMKILATLLRLNFCLLLGILDSVTLGLSPRKES